VGLIEPVLQGLVFGMDFTDPLFEGGGNMIRMNGRNHLSKFALAPPPEMSDWRSNRYGFVVANVREWN
jgi:hypothetical protein